MTCIVPFQEFAAEVDEEGGAGDEGEEAEEADDRQAMLEDWWKRRER